jgi:hypothetical protein
VPLNEERQLIHFALLLPDRQPGIVAATGDGDKKCLILDNARVAGCSLAV